MKNTDDNLSPNKKKEPGSDALIYLLLFMLVALLVGGLVWYWYDNRNNQEKQWEQNYEKELDKFSVSPTADEVIKLIQGNRNRRKTAKRILAGEMRGRTLTNQEKKEVEKELAMINEKWAENLQGFNMKEIEKENPTVLAKIYAGLYEQGKITTRLKYRTSVSRPLEELKKQEQIQKVWDVSDQEAVLIKEEVNKWITKWYTQAEQELIGNEPGKYPRLTEFVVPVWHKGKKVTELTPELINEYKKKSVFQQKDGTSKTIDYSQTLKIKFNGYSGFLTEKEKKNSSEGKEVFGLTTSDGVSFVSDQNHKVKLEKDTTNPVEGSIIPSEYYLVKTIGDNCRDIKIGFEKKMFFNRLGYEEWLTEVTDKGGRTYHDICFEECLETMAHELAHAIVGNIKGEYEGEEGGGHGQLFYEIMKKIETMIKNSPDFSDFKTWWEKAEKEQQELAIGSIAVKPPSHWDEWKYWYIGGGALILAIGIGLVIVFWDTDSKKNAKN